MLQFFQKLFAKIDNKILTVMDSQIHDEVNKIYLIVQIQILNHSYYFGPFNSIEQMTKWLSDHNVDHLRYNIIDVRDPHLPRDEWPL